MKSVFSFTLPPNCTLDFVVLILLSIFILVWFLFTENNLISLILLLGMVVICSNMIWKVFLSSWPVLIYLIPTSTGLYIMFSYVISVDSKNKVSEPKIKLFPFLLGFFFPIILAYFFIIKVYFHEMTYPNVWWTEKFTPLASESIVLIIIIFLILIIVFII
nr:NADH dehydrogenase subunit 6 [Actornithophilus gracilis]